MVFRDQLKKVRWYGLDYIKLCFCVVLLSLPLLSYSQSPLKLTSIGTDIGGTLFNSSSFSGPLSSQYHFFGRHQLTKRYTGEANLGLVFLSNRLQKSRLFSFDYRVLYPIKPLFNVEYTSDRFSPYIYTGVGLSKYQLLNVGVQDDPLLRESDSRIPNTSIWSNSNGWSVEIPIGLGIDYKLNQNAGLRFTAGYHLTSQSVIDNASGLKGYLGVTIGMTFNLFNQGVEKPSPRMHPINMDEVTYAKPIPFSIEGDVPKTNSTFGIASSPTSNIMDNRSFQPIHYKTLEFRPDEKVQQTLEEVIRLLDSDPQLIVKIRAFADERGNKTMNQSLTNLRSWGVAQQLLEKGIAPSRVYSIGYGEEKSTSDDQAIDYATSRRTEIKLNYEEPETTSKKDYTIVPEVFTETEFPSSTLSFKLYSDELSESAKRRLKAISEYLIRHPEYEAQISGSGEPNGSPELNRMLQHARAASALQFLLDNGISYERLLIVNRPNHNQSSRTVSIRINKNHHDR